MSRVLRVHGGAALVFVAVALVPLLGPVLGGHAIHDDSFAARFRPQADAGPASQPGAGLDPGIAALERAGGGDPLTPYRRYYASAQSEDLNLCVWPDHAWTRESVRSGRLPLWRPDVMGGVPARSVSISSPWTPLSWPGYLLPPVSGRTVMVLLHLTLAGFAFYLFLMQRGRRWAAAVAGGAAYMLNPLCATYLTYGDFVPVFALLPLNLIAVARLVSAPRPWRAGAALAALTALLFLSGGSLYAAYATMVQLCAALVFSSGGWRPRLRAAVMCGMATLVGLAAAGVELLPLVEVASHSFRTPDKYASTNSMPAAGLLSWLFPRFFGHPGDGDFAGGFLFFRHYSGFYGLSPGVVILALAVAGAVAARAWLAAAAVVLLNGGMVLLSFAPVHELAAAVLPGFDRFHVLRLLIVGFLLQAVLAARGVDALLDGKLPRRPLWILAGVMVLVAVALDVAARWAGADGGSLLLVHVQHLARRGSLLLSPRVLVPVALVAALIALAIVAARRGRLPTVAAVGLLVAVALELGLLARPGVPSTPATAIAGPAEAAAALRAKMTRPGRLVGLTEADSFPPSLGDHFPANTAAALGFEDLRAFMRIPPSPMAELMAAATRSGFLEYVSFRDVSLPLFDLLDVRYVLSSSAPGGPERFAPLAAGLWENQRAVGRAFFTRCVEEVPDAEARLQTLVSPGLAPMARAIVDSPVAGVQSCARDDAAFEVPIASRPDARTVELDVNAPAAGVLVLSESYFPGWQVTVDGIEQEVLRVDHALRGAVLTPGHHHVVFHYAPGSLRDGALLSLFGWLVILGAAVLRRPRRLPPDDVLIGGLAFLLLAAFATTAPMPNDNDALYAGVMRHLRDGGSPFMLKVGGVAFMDKPPLFFLVGALFTAVGGEGLFVLRLTALLAGVAGVVLVARTTRLLLGRAEEPTVRAAAALAGLSLLAAPSYYEYSRRIYMEVPVAVLGFWAFELGLRGLWKRSGLAAGLAFMLKSVVGVLGFGALGLAHLLHRRLPRGLVVASLIALGVIVPWHLVAYLSDPPTFLAFTVDLHVKHQIAEAQPWSRGGPLFYLQVLFTEDVIMGVLLVIGVVFAVRTWRKERRFEVTALLVAIAVQLALYTVSATKKPFYLLTAYPFIAVLGGLAIARWLEVSASRRRMTALVSAALAALFVLQCGRLVLPDPAEDQSTYVAPLAARMGALSRPDEKLYTVDFYMAAAEYASRRDGIFAVPDEGVRTMLMRIPYLRFGDKVVVWDPSLLRQGGWAIAPAPKAARLAAADPTIQVVARNQAFWLLRGGGR